MNRIATRHFNNVWTLTIVICNANKWYFNIFPAGTEASSHTMANLFHTEMVWMRTERQRAAAPSTKEATGSQTFAKARKLSMLPKGCYFIKTLYYENMIL